MRRKLTKNQEAYRRVRLESISHLKKRVWKEFSTFIRNRDNWTCFTCGKTGKGTFMHAGHYISRKHQATLFDERNVNAQCMNCNMWGYGNTGVYTLNLTEKYGQGIVKELTDLSKTTKQWSKPELEKLLEKYKAPQGKEQDTKG